MAGRMATAQRRPDWKSLAMSPVLKLDGHDLGAAIPDIPAVIRVRLGVDITAADSDRLHRLGT
jgi:hypothetical protein